VRAHPPSPALVIACLALGVALGGTSYAVTRLPRRSVGTEQLKVEAVTRSRIRDSAIVGVKVAPDALKGADIVEGSLGTVPSARRAGEAGHAAQADHASAADHAAVAGALDQVDYRAAAGSVAAAVEATESAPATTAEATATAHCDPGSHATGGGVQVEEGSGLVVGDDYPSGSTAWIGRVESSDPAPHTFTVFVVCARSETAG
jgi:hypothetical protein